MSNLTFTVPEELLRGLEDCLRRAIVDALQAEDQRLSHGFLDVAGAASFLTFTPAAIRSLVKRHAIPYHKTTNGRLLFDRRELEAWVRSG
ncbi:MAG: helix-turn-helix domain-containing protein [Gaiellaceae bacterium]